MTWQSASITGMSILLSRHRRARLFVGGDDVYQDGPLLLCDDFYGTGEYALQVVRVLDRAEALDVEGTGQGGKIGRRLVERDPDIFVLDRALPHARHVFLVALIVAVQAVVVDDRQHRKAE